MMTKMRRSSLLQGFDEGTCKNIKAGYPPEILNQLQSSSLEALEGAVAAYTLVSLHMSSKVTSRKKE